MARWTFWEWVAYACLFIGAIIIAADTGFRVSPMLAEKLPELLHSAKGEHDDRGEQNALPRVVLELGRHQHEHVTHHRH
jgi:hypothetical protein